MNHRANRAIEKAPGACDSKGLTTYTNAPDFATPEPQGKAVVNGGELDTSVAE